jgi:hypothetical protein
MTKRELKERGLTLFSTGKYASRAAAELAVLEQEQRMQIKRKNESQLDGMLVTITGIAGCDGTLPMTLTKWPMT